MRALGRGWDHGERFRPAAEVDIRYGRGLLKTESENWPDYLAVTGSTAWNHAQRYLAKLPIGIGVVKLPDWGHLEEVTQTLPDDAKLVVGFGGGMALDSSKYVALRKNLPLRLVPTAVSTGAIIHGVFGKFKGRGITGNVQEWPFCDFENVVIDYDLVLEAPPHLNTAGLGDVLCMYSSIAEWRHKSSRGLAPTVDEQLVRPVVEFFESVVAGFPQTLGPDGTLTSQSVRFIMTAIQDRDVRLLKSPHGSGAGHAMTGPFEEAAQRGLVHGEMAALGSVIVCWATGDATVLTQWLDRCQVRYLPKDLGVTREELRRALALTPQYMASRKIDSVLVREPITGNRFDQVWKSLE